MSEPVHNPIFVESSIRRFWFSVLLDDSWNCWEWTGSKDKDGYGKIRFLWKHMRAHRVSFELNVRKLKPGEIVCHKCDNPSCVNPSHLFVGSNSDNMKDMVIKGRSLSMEKHPRAKITSKQATWVKILYASGMKSSDISAKTGVDKATISKIVSGKNWKDAKGPKCTLAKRGERTRGSRHWRSRLDESAVRQIKRLREGGMPGAEIARAFGIAPQIVCSITKGRSWAHVK